METTKTKFHIEPMDANSVFPSQVFEPRACAERLNQLYKTIVSMMAMEENQQISMEYKKRFETPPSYNYTLSQLEERFGKEAMQEAMLIIEAERHNVVEARADYIKNKLNISIQQLRFLVFTEHGKGKIYIKKVAIEGKVAQDSPSEREVGYFESYPGGIEHLERIGKVLGMFTEFNDFVPYLNEELTALYQQARDLATLETVWEKK